MAELHEGTIYRVTYRTSPITQRTVTRTLEYVMTLIDSTGPQFIFEPLSTGYRQIVSEWALLSAEEVRQYWRSPSGRIHSMRRCSGAALAKAMKAVRLSEAEFLAADRCRCSSWRS